jgi:hypothetical protein
MLRTLVPAVAVERWRAVAPETLQALEDGAK